ncbi:DeoR/GlpR family DNA-binding transcription regulator [Pseudarthrobacter scleromae]|uniref:hypothetical protein n=1 Tax=Pseudarthrobacter scleromae TaxID=158897 RepID=UPI0027E3F293|nr:hypothetical protein [Pseudarthrobacter scleromae]
MLDAGSTARAVALELRGFEKLSVTTPGINTLQGLADSEGFEMDCLGGRLRAVPQSFAKPTMPRQGARSSRSGGGVPFMFWQIPPSSGSGRSTPGRSWPCRGHCDGRRRRPRPGAEVPGRGDTSRGGSVILLTPAG